MTTRTDDVRRWAERVEGLAPESLDDLREPGASEMIAPTVQRVDGNIKNAKGLTARRRAAGLREAFELRRTHFGFSDDEKRDVAILVKRLHELVGTECADTFASAASATDELDRDSNSTIEASEGSVLSEYIELRRADPTTFPADPDEQLSQRLVSMVSAEYQPDARRWNRSLDRVRGAIADVIRNCDEIELAEARAARDAAGDWIHSVPDRAVVVGQHIIANPGKSHGELLQELSGSRSTVERALKELKEAKLVVVKKRKYFWHSHKEVREN